MTYYFCLISDEDAKTGINIGRKYAYEHRDEWVVGADDLPLYLTAGYMKGMDFVTYDGKAYFIMKTFIDLNEGFVLLVCKESIMGCDKPDDKETVEVSDDNDTEETTETEESPEEATE